jgi:hypothetical protein
MLGGRYRATVVGNPDAEINEITAFSFPTTADEHLIRG